ncbi:PIG-L deacetylase family protein [Paenibacillus nasutitermitis]|uniref:GlcNAc-PI de-N-acetylase n=1 Tax=Paenibacillus nasutitermitis TaxID=1652958 RepID=A0A916ZGQ3_9BACL|nr:PIG-L family deacetylase [Paenibacillus nasutitermitis]GGD96794.1 GlcNAc-PI de-N-acetylase [Paenibacillus nasutitermitis]
MRVLACCAHPDDAEILVGGTLAKYSKRGDEVFIAITTNGEVGHPTWPKEEVARVRQEEAEKAAARLGAQLFWLGFRDEFLFDNEETRLALINVIRKCRPDVILTHWPGDLYNPDHTVTGQMANDVAIMTTVPNIVTEAPPCEKIPVVYFMDSLAGVGFVPDEYVDISDSLDMKMQALHEHHSQVNDWLSDQYGGSIMEMVEVSAKYRGFQCGVRYAEGFIRAKAWPRGVAGTLLP